MNKSRDTRGRLKEIGRVVSLDKKTPSNTNLLVGKTIKGGNACKTRRTLIPVKYRNLETNKRIQKYSRHC
jgi:hypothetical protein